MQSQSPTSTDASVTAQTKKFNFWRWFWLSTIPFSLGLLWYSFYNPGNNVSWSKDYASAEKQATQSRKPMILFFSGKWCSPCRIMERTVWADHEVETTVNAKFTTVMIDVDDPRASALVSRYRVGATPTTIITDPQGKVLQQVQGGMGKVEFLGLLSNADLSTHKL
jgi:thioredoxin 1